MRNTQWSLRKKNVWKQRGVVVGLLMVAIIMLGCGEAYAERHCPLRFGAWMDQEGLKDYTQELGEEFAPEYNVLILPQGDAFIVFYKNYNFYLSTFRQGKETRLWTSGDDEIEGFNSNLVPGSQLALGQLDANTREDILACYTVDFGTSSYGQRWKRSLMLILDGQTTITPPIPLSWVESFLYGKKNDDTAWLGDLNENQAFRQESRVLLFPGWEEQPLTIVVWSFIERYEHPPTHAQDSAIFQVRTYHITGTQAVLTGTVEGTYAATTASIRAAIQARQAQQDAPEPIFLDFMEHGSEYCVDEHEWFGLWQHRRVIEP